MTAPTPPSQRLRVAHLNPRAPTHFDLQPDASARQAIAEELGIPSVQALRFQGQITAQGGDAWALDGRLTARVVQPCVVTLAPVRSTIDEPVERLYSPHVMPPEGDEVEMPDETVEPLGAFIDLDAVMIEQLALALPEYPRAEGAELSQRAVEDAAPDTRRPFAGLDKLMGGGGQQEPEG